jgi:hypothetical protein
MFIVLSSNSATIVVKRKEKPLTTDTKEKNSGDE